MKIGVYYGSSTGNTQAIAESIASSFKTEAIDIVNANISDMLENEFLILGTSTWGDGELQDDWLKFLPSLEGADLSGKKVALFGLGDQEGYSHVFVDGIYLIYEVLGNGVELVGKWEDDNYDFEQSKAFIDDKFLGLAIDEDNQDDLTEDRVNSWVNILKSEVGI